MWVSFGQSSRPIGAPTGATGQQRIALRHAPPNFSTSKRPERLNAAAAELFDVLRRGVVTVAINQRFALKDVAQAQQALEGRQTTGSTVLVP
ncbi:MAG: zinc-binding dehydrogenase [Caldilineaceae bacterium]